MDDGKGYCPECEEVVDLKVEDNSHGCHTVYDYIDECSECGESTLDHEPETCEACDGVGSVDVLNCDVQGSCSGMDNDGAMASAGKVHHTETCSECDGKGTV